ncbi:pheromone processing endoprotease [Serendipita sp. 398]|nr:pheromone processing endoprotease [Serendipita sp. 398]
MRLLGLLLFLASPALLEASLRPVKRSYDTHDYFVLHHDPRHGHSLEDSTTAIGAEFVEQVGELKNFYLVRYEKSQISDSDPLESIIPSLQKRGDTLHLSIRSLTPQILRRRVKRAPIPTYPTIDEVTSRMDIKDPSFKTQWHIINPDYPEHMVNVTGLWEEGVTGKGVISALLDDGLDYNSEDLAANFYAAGSHDFNDHEDLPTPKLWDDHHGTRCAGEIAAVKNDVCGIGLAYESKVAGIRILSGPISDADEAISLNFGYQENAIYSCSWGPPDTGRDMEAPNLLITRAMLNGVNNGRGGKGSIFVFASGNGAAAGDSCNFDGYTNSIWTVTVGAIDHQGLHPYYSEACSANLIVTYSSGSGRHISTTDVGQRKCSDGHGGTSAAAPLAVGVFALALDVRPDLTWRDIQHLSVYSAAPINPEDPDWERTASGRRFSYKYGYGKLDAYALVTMARTWKLVKPQAWMEMPTIELEDASMENGEMKGGQLLGHGGIKSSTIITSDMMEDSNLEKLEHITVKVWIRHTKRGDVEVELTSPAGIKSTLAPRRKNDSAGTGYIGWTFMTVKHWDENPVGEWTIRVFDQENEQKGYFLGWSMIMWGSSIDPDYAERYQIADDPNEGHNLPPHPTASVTTSRHHAKPTAHLPSDHASQPGEATRPAFPTEDAKQGSATTTPTSPPNAPDEGVFTHMYDLMANQLWLVGAFGVVIIFGAGAGWFLWNRRRKAKRTKAAYVPLAGSGGDTMAMRSMAGGAGGAGSGGPSGARSGSGERSAGGTRELYDAFGVGSDDDDDEVDENSALTGSNRFAQQATVTYHDGFLDDEGLSTANTGRTPYRDEPLPGSGTLQQQPQQQMPSPTREGSDGSGDGSWQDASEGRS